MTVGKSTEIDDPNLWELTDTRPTAVEPAWD